MNDGERDRQTEKQGDRHTEKQRDRETETKHFDSMMMMMMHQNNSHLNWLALYTSPSCLSVCLSDSFRDWLSVTSVYVNSQIRRMKNENYNIMFCFFFFFFLSSRFICFCRAAHHIHKINISVTPSSSSAFHFLCLYALQVARTQYRHYHPCCLFLQFNK